MQRRLEKIARELQSFDEASLMQLWEHYHDIVKRFEPTKKWEESVLVLGLIQTVHWKNQLFNLKWADSKKGSVSSSGMVPAKKDGLAGLSRIQTQKKEKKPAKLLPFQNRSKDRQNKE